MHICGAAKSDESEPAAILWLRTLMAMQREQAQASWTAVDTIPHLQDPALQILCRELAEG
jgi:hypothetical protein